MSATRPGYSFSVFVAAIVAVFAFSAINPADAQERKSIRWATSSTGSYGYKVAAQMVQVFEEALGGEYTVTVNPYPSTTAAMKAAMDGEAEIGYTADVGMTQLYDGDGGFKDYKPAKSKMVHTWYAYPMESFMAVSAPKAGQFKSWSDFSGKPVFFTPAGFMNWLNFQRIYKALGYEFKHVQIGEPAQGDALQAGTIVGAVAYTTAGRSLPILLEGDRGAHGHQGDQSRARMKSRSSPRRTSLPWRSIRSRPSARTSACRRSWACRSCSATTCAPICRRRSSTRC